MRRWAMRTKQPCLTLFVEAASISFNQKRHAYAISFLGQYNKMKQNYLHDEQLSD